MLSLTKATVLFLALGLCDASPHHGHHEHQERGTSTSSKTTSTTSSRTTSTTPVKTTPTTTSSTSKSSTSTSRTTASSSSTSAAAQSISAAANAPAGFVPGVKWQIQIQDPVDMRGGMLPSDAKVVDVDLFMASKDATLIPALHVSQPAT